MDEFNKDRPDEPTFPDPAKPPVTPQSERPVPPEEDWGIPERSSLPKQCSIPQQGSVPPQNGIPPQNGGISPQYGSIRQQGNIPQQPDYGDAPVPFRYTQQPGGGFPPPVPPHFSPQYTYTVPPVPKETVSPMNRRIYSMAAVVAVLVFLLCVYCIGSDILNGALGSGTEVRNVTVELLTQEKPDLDPNDENVTADGTYTVKGVAELVKPSIVEVHTYDSDTRSNGYLVGTGSGIIISEDGYIVTNAHVVEGTAFDVVLNDERKFEAQLIGSDHKTDLAVLKINANHLVPAVLGNSDETYVGEQVAAIGNPAGFTNTVTVGVVSAMNRQIRAESNAFMMDCIQTDAAISPGNSGGALVNMYGQVIGITSSKYASQYSGVYEGLGFAITINAALPILTDLMESGYVSGRFRIGITFMEMKSSYAEAEFEEKFGMPLPEILEGALWISEVSEDCDISNTDLQPDDFIVEIEGENVAGFDDLLDILDGYQGGDMVTASCVRIQDGELVWFEIEFMLESDTSGNF